MQFLSTLFVILIIALIPLVLYALTKCGKDFDLISWVLFSKSRLALGFLLILLLSALITFVPEAEIVLSAIGFNPDKSSVGIGLAVGGLLVAGIRGDDEK